MSVLSVAEARERGVTCDRAIFYAFGASYPDGECVDGYLYDSDSYDDGGLTVGGDIPCPLCTRSEYDQDTADGGITVLVADLVPERPLPARDGGLRRVLYIGGAGGED